VEEFCGRGIAEYGPTALEEGAGGLADLGGEGGREGGREGRREGRRGEKKIKYLDRCGGRKDRMEGGVEGGLAYPGVIDIVHEQGHVAEIN